MPIKVYQRSSTDEIAWLCDDVWDLPSQVSELEAWLDAEGGKIAPGDYIADIGFRPSPNAVGGGAALTPKSMRIMADLGVELFLSEYPVDAQRVVPRPGRCPEEMQPNQALQTTSMARRAFGKVPVFDRHRRGV